MFAGPERYGDECFYGKLSLLHFIIFFFLGGLTVLVVGIVQFKKEAGFSNFRYHFLVAGGILISIGNSVLTFQQFYSSQLTLLDMYRVRREKVYTQQ